MLQRHRLILAGVFSLQLLAACGSSSVGTESGTIAPPMGLGAPPLPPVPPPKAAPVGGGVNGSDDTVSATTSISGTLSVAVGATQTVSVSFTSADGLPVTGFAVSGSLGTLPPGWSGPNSFTCAAVGPGSGCVLDLTYAPTGAGSGTLNLQCVYVDNAGLPRTPGPCLALSYAAIVPNNVVASATPAGEIDAPSGAKQTVSVNFTTDDGNAATNFTVSTALGALPAGWSSPATGLSCAIVSTGSGCHLPLVFTPAAAGGGTLSINYSYVDGSGASRTGAFNIPYATVAHDTVVASASPSGEVTAAEMKGSRSVAVTFNTNDGATASDLILITDLSTLPAGWSSAAKGFTCAAVSTGNGCQLQLTYAPTALGSGTLALRYAYNDAAGTANAGLLNIAYAATTDDNVVATASPSGEINAMLGAAAQPVTLTFVTDDNRLATGLQVTSNLAALPAGWSSAAGSFACSEVIGGTACQLTLMYAPTALDNGTLTIQYAYVNNAGTSRTASLDIPYRTTTNDSVLGTAVPTALAVITGSNNAVTVTFATDDGNLAGPLSADLTALPAEWSSASSTLNCASVSTGSTCQVALTYAPTVAANATLSFGFNYTNAAGTPKSGTVSIPYVATIPPPPLPPPGP
jgi:hypothetical protein